jgi:cytochrome c oxidase subunit 2
MVVLMIRRAGCAGVVFLLAWSLAAAGRASTQDGAAGQPQVVDVTAERFSFTPSEFRVKAGAPVEIRLRSDDTNHGFRILDTDVNVRIPKRGKGVVTVTFQPAQAGRYVFECSKLCGAGHSFMRGTIIVD